jgi:succinate dehydrogenase hydrophobic anchor subunit
MQKWLHSFVKTPGDGDERVMSLSNRSHALAGQVISFLLIAYVLVKGFIMQRPSSEYIFCFILWIVYMLIYKVSDVRSGIDKETKPANKWKRLSLMFFVSVVVVGVNVYRDVASGEEVSTILFAVLFTMCFLGVGYAIYSSLLRTFKPAEIGEE